MVGAARFERATSCSQGTRSNQTELCPEQGKNIRHLKVADKRLLEFTTEFYNNRIHRGIEYKTPKKEALGVCYSGGFG